MPGIAANAPESKRIHFIDSGRALASILGIFFHSALVFSAPWEVNVDRADLSIGLYVYQYVIWTFRMPLFLFVSGYFANHALTKHNPSAFLIQRARRIVVPFVASAVTLLPVQLYFIELFAYGDGWRRHYLAALNPLAPSFSMGHLWFLYDLAVFTLAIFLFRSLRRRVTVPALISTISEAMHRRFSTALVLWCAINILTTTVGGQIGSRLGVSAVWLPVAQLAHNLPMFLFGCYCFSRPNVMDRLIQPSLRRSIATLLILTALIPIAMHLASLVNQPNRSADIVMSSIVVDVVVRWVATVGVITLLKQVLNRRIAVLQYLADVSYPVYLFHHPIVIAVAYAYVTYSRHLPTVAGYVVVCATSLVATYLIVELLVKRTMTTAFLFTGVWPKVAEMPYRKTKLAPSSSY